MEVVRPDFASGSLHPNLQPRCEAKTDMTRTPNPLIIHRTRLFGISYTLLARHQPCYFIANPNSKYWAPQRESWRPGFHRKTETRQVYFDNPTCRGMFQTGLVSSSYVRVTLEPPANFTVYPIICVWKPVGSLVPSNVILQ